MSGWIATIVDSGGMPVSDCENAMPMVPIAEGGIPVTIIADGGMPVTFMDENFVRIPGGISVDLLRQVDITVTRAGTATYFGSTGALQDAAANTARIDYTPSTLARRGLLVEPSATNIMRLSNAFDDAGWTKTNVTVGTGYDDGEGGTTAFLLTATANGGVLQRAETVVSGSVYTGAFWMKRVSGSGQVSLRVGDLTLIPVTLTSEWTLIDETTTPTSTTGRLAISFATSGNAVAIKYAQLEAGSFSTSYIKTSASTVTRAADQCIISGDDFSAFWNASEGTIVCEFEGRDLMPAASRYIFDVNDGTADERIAAYISTAGKVMFIVFIGGVTVVSKDLGEPTAGVNKFAITYSADDCTGALNGVAVAADTDTGEDLPTVDRVTLGVNATYTASTYLNGWIKSAYYYGVRLADAELERLTS